MLVIIRFGCKRIFLKIELLKNNILVIYLDSGFFFCVNYLWFEYRLLDVIFVGRC